MSLYLARVGGLAVVGEPRLPPLIPASVPSAPPKMVAAARAGQPVADCGEGFGPDPVGVPVPALGGQVADEVVPGFEADMPDERVGAGFAQQDAEFGRRCSDLLAPGVTVNSKCGDDPNPSPLHARVSHIRSEMSCLT